MRAEPHSKPQRNLLKGLLAGASGGLIASLAMSEFSSLLLQNKSHSQPGKEDSTVRAASAISQTIFHHELTSGQKKIAGSAMHYAFGMTMAALYGVIVEFRESARLGRGLPFGVAIWLGAHVVMVPALGLSEPVTRAAPDTEAAEFGAHLVYGVVVESLRRSLRKSVLC
jgi:putative membrane protein